MKIENYMIIIGVFFALYGLLEIFSKSGLSINPTTALLGIMLIIGGVFVRKGYRNKTFYLAMFSTLALIGLATIYGFIFIPLDPFDNYLNIGIFLFFLIIYSRAYLRRHKAVKLPWKDEW